ncbi:hypothetical protein PR048_029655 [Dryococelus australis]|uniref:Uncharacterized protein n=1 Tax=Dryococelus australis TaxID=614101 RepID=A0ABQ9GEM4_9NEOP|nr:hypothetical protein PR048_029655 [Dryococelus australis]
MRDQRPVAPTRKAPNLCAVLPLLHFPVQMRSPARLPPRRTGFKPGRVTSGFSHVGIVTDCAAGRWVFSGISSLPRPFTPALLQITLIGSQGLAGRGIGEGNGPWPFVRDGPIPAFAWSDFWRPWKTEIRMAGPGIEPGSSRVRVHLARVLFQGRAGLVSQDEITHAAKYCCCRRDVNVSRLHSRAGVSSQVVMPSVMLGGETGDPRENPPTYGIVRHDSHMRKSELTQSGIEHGSPWWEVSGLTAQPPWPLYHIEHSVGMQGRRETGDPRENPPTSDVVRAQFPLAKIPEVAQSGIEPGSLWWEASCLTAKPPPPWRGRKSLLTAHISPFCGWFEITYTFLGRHETLRCSENLHSDSH